MFPQTKLVTTYKLPKDSSLHVELDGESHTKCSGFWIGPKLFLWKLSSYTAQDQHLISHFSKKLRFN